LSPATPTLETAREAFPVTRECIYLNTGTYGPMPEPALQELLEATAAAERQGIACTRDIMQDVNRARQGLAAMVGVEPGQIAMSRNSTDGINLVLAGLDWRPGDEVITTDEEHEAMWHPLLYLRATRGIVVHRISVSPDAETMVERLRQVASQRTKLLTFSHVPCETGTRLPAAAMCRWAREHGIATMVDGAQSVGAVPVTLPELGCDWLAGNGHKWLHGPKGTGFLAATPEAMLALRPAHVGAGSLAEADWQAGRAVPHATGERFEYGSRDLARWAGMHASLDWMGVVGWPAIHAHIARHASALKEGLLSLPGVRLLTPVAAEASAGLVSFVIQGHSFQAVMDHARSRRSIHLRPVPHYNATRAATSVLTNSGDVEALLEVLRELPA
jgi:L-cysteine/cystine lyase